MSIDDRPEAVGEMSPSDFVPFSGCVSEQDEEYYGRRWSRGHDCGAAFRDKGWEAEVA